MSFVHLRLRTEYSFRRGYGKLPQVLEVVGEQDSPAAGICDSGTWGHVPWSKECKKTGVKPLFGCEVKLVKNARTNERQNGPDIALIAKTSEGLSELYRLISWSNKPVKEGGGFYYFPRIDYRDLDNVSDSIFVLAGSGVDLNKLPRRSNFYLELSPAYPAWNQQACDDGRWPIVVVADNFYPRVSDRDAYEILVGRNKYSRTLPMHIMSEAELRVAIPCAPDEAFENTGLIAEACNASLPRAEMVVPEKPETLEAMCRKAAPNRGVDLNDETYTARLKRELDMIEEKGFEDYFYVVADLCDYAKRHMLVGPARGSSAGSLVCYLLGITDVDPIVHGLMFERFIDITRADLPDIDIDFQDNRRELVIQYLRDKYGEERVGRIGTVNRYKAKSTIGEVAGALNVPVYEVKDVKDSIIERSTGDARAAFCIQDTLESLDIGKALLAKYPKMSIAGEMEMHARHAGMHAAGVIVTNEPLDNYCAANNAGASMIDKKDAEDLNLLKLDILGLRTLSIIQDCLDQIGKDREWLVRYPLEDEEAFEVLNAERFSGIFQFEGYALQSLARQMKVKDFNDIVAITTLARPGPLHSGGATQYIARRTGREPITYLHALAEDLTEESQGIIIYQEQVMSVGRRIGKLSWEDVSTLRKAMSKSLGEEFFNKYWLKFRDGAAEHGIPEAEADKIWKNMCTFGSWAFNKSHAVSYGLVSYWCCVLKARYPLEFAAATMRNIKDDDSGIKILRDLVKEGFEYIPVDPKKSGLTWEVHDGKLVGGLTNVKGVGPAKAKQIITLRRGNKPYPPGIAKLLVAPTTPYDDIFEVERRFGDYYVNPKKYNVLSGSVSYIQDVQEKGEYVIIGKLKEKNLRDLNEYGNVVKRGGRLVKNNNLFLNMVIEDDTGPIIAKIDRWNYPVFGKPIVESGKIGDIFLFKGRITQDGWRLFMIDKVRKIS